jgi:hypothetical protein
VQRLLTHPRNRQYVGSRRICHCEHHVSNEPFELVVLDKLLVELRVVLDRTLCGFDQCLVMGEPGRVRRIGLGVLERWVSRS